MIQVGSNKLQKLPPYLFAEIDRRVQEAKKRGVDIIDLGIGDPDLPSPDVVVKEMQSACADSSTHRYPSYAGMFEFCKACADHLAKKLGINLEPNSQILTLIGAKEGIFHLPLALVNEGDVVLIPDPGYPVYFSSTIFAGGEPYFMPLNSVNGFLPDLSAIPSDVARRAKLMFINYPNNPTTACASFGFFNDVVKFAQDFDLIIAHDAPYLETGFDGYQAPSILQAKGSLERTIEFHSLSKTFNMTGWRIGFVAGSSEVIAALGKIKTHADSGVFEAVQRAGITALRSGMDHAEWSKNIYRKRRDIAVQGLAQIGINVQPPKATFYIWFPLPVSAASSTQFALDVLEKAGVVITPGVGFGANGEGYCRMALTVSEERLKEVFTRLKNADLA